MINLNENIEDINLKDLLRVINDRIIGLLDKDHCIGHSYFMNVEFTGFKTGIF